MIKKMGTRGLVQVLTVTFAVAAPASASAATFTVNTTNDTLSAGACAAATAGQCSLREAVIESNATAGANTINLPAGTYTLTRSAGTPGVDPTSFTSQNNELDLQNNVTISGAGSGSTIIQAGTTISNGISLIFIVNGYTGATPVRTVDAAISGVTLRFGRNQYTHNGWGFGGAIEFESGDGGTLTLNNDVITQNSTTDGSGGGVASFNDPPTGTASSNASRTTISNSTISNNTATLPPGFSSDAGGVFAGTLEPLFISNSTISGNSVTGTTTGFAGGIGTANPALLGIRDSITNTTIADNTAVTDGAGAYLRRPTDITNDTFTGNTLSGAGSSGGGLESLSIGGTTIVSGSTFTGNSAANGGAIENRGPLTLTDSRIAGNTATTGSGVDQNLGNGATTMQATDVWWGCNTGPSAAPCDTATDEDTGGGDVFTTSPWVQLKSSASPTVIDELGTSTVTGSFLQDSAGNVLTTTQIAPLIGLPVTWHSVHGSTPASSTIGLDGKVTALLTQDGSCNNLSGEPEVDSIPNGDATATATVTVHCPDLTATKTDDVGGATTVGNHWSWKVHVANAGDAATSFASGQTILTDNLPNSDIGYGSASVSGATGITGTGSVSCQITANDLSCSASGGTVIIAASTGVFDVSFTATPTATGTFANPRGGGVCAVDPNNVIAESNETNNACSDSVTVTAPDLTATKTDDVGGATTVGNHWSWKVHVANAGDAATSFASGQTILTDNLPNSDIGYGSASVSGATGITGTGSVSCQITANDLSCSASGGTVIIAASTGVFDVSFTATPTATGTFANPRGGGVCAVDPNNVIAESNETNNACSDSVTVTAPDLTATKTDDVGGATTVGNHWSWKVHVANAGDAAATFSSGQTILTDNLPNANINYGSVTVANETAITGSGTISCSIASSTLTCAASGGTVVIGASTGSFDVSFTATPTAAGSFANPRSGGACSVDPANVVAESDETNNACADTVTVTAADLTAVKTDNVGGATTLGNSWTWKVHVANAGNAAATFAGGQTILTDNLPNTNISYGSVTVANQTAISGSGTIACSISSSDLTCKASGGTVVVGASTGAFDVSFSATPTAAGSFVNPRSGGACSVDPANVVVESDETNNACADTVTVTAPDLTATKTDNVGGATSLGNHWTWKVHVANGGNAGATFAGGATILTDNLPASNIAYGSVSVANQTAISGSGTISCSIASNDLSCKANGGTVVVGASTGAFDVSFTATPTAAGSFVNPRSGGTCAVDPADAVVESDETNNACADTVTVTAPDLTATKTDDVGGSTSVGNHWTWKVHVANGGGAGATFASGATILTDNLPASNINYGSVGVSNQTAISGPGTISCQISSNDLNCTASGGSVTIGAATGAFDVSFTATPTAAGSFVNPRSGGTCAVDPANVVVESDETNNSCADTVTVGAADLTATKTDNVGGSTTLGNSWTWKVHVANGGGASATFASGATILTDNLPASNINYGSVGVSNQTAISGPGTISCQISSNDLNCTASGGSVTIGAATGAFDVSFTATPTAAGSFVNPRSGGTCAVDPANVVVESDETNNSCADTVTVGARVGAPDLTATKTDNVGGSTTLGNSWTWKVHVANGGGASATFASGATILTDNLPGSNINYGSVGVSNQTAISGPGTISCQISSNDLNCTASGGSVTIGAATGAFDVSFTATPTAAGSFVNPRSGGTCAVDPANVVVESDETNNSCADTVTVGARVGAPDLTATKTDNVGGSTTLGNSWTWKVHVANGGSADATFAGGQTILADDLPNSNIHYGSVSLSNQTAISGFGTIACSIASSTLTCTANGGSVGIGASTGAFDVSFAATPTAPGSFANPRSGGSCSVDPNNVVAESDETNNSCADTVTAVGPPKVTLTTPPDGATYRQGARVRARYSCQDAQGAPGIRSCVGTAPSGTLIGTARLGTHKFTVTATSKDGLRTTVIHRYTIVAHHADNHFVVRKIRVRPNGVVQFQITIPGPGVINVLETARDSDQAAADSVGGPPMLPVGRHRFAFARGHLVATGAGTIDITITPNDRGKLLVEHHKPHPIYIRLWISYRPAGGIARRQGFYGLLLPQ